MAKMRLIQSDQVIILRVDFRVVPGFSLRHFTSIREKKADFTREVRQQTDPLLK